MKFAKKQSSNKLLRNIGIYTAIFLVVIIIGLIIFWNYIDAYEDSQPKNVMDSYISQFSAKNMQVFSRELFESVNPEVQTEQDCLDAISDAVSGGVTYARKMSECTEDKMVYMLMSNGNTIGKVILTPQGKGSFGFTPWQVAEESFDFSFLLKEPVTINVPQHYKVYANGKLLSSRCIVQQDMPIDVLKDFYAEYNTLPYIATYEIGPYLGDLEITIADAEGKTVTPEDASNVAFILDNCSDAEKDTLDYLVSEFIGSYVRFTTNADGALDQNYKALLHHIVPGSDLAERVADALGGLKWVKNQDAQILSSTTHYRTRLAGGYYLYDISYEVSVTHQGNTVTTTENVRIMLAQTEEGLKVEKMINY